MAATESKAMHAVRTALAAVALALIALAPAGLQAQGQPAAAGGAGLESLVIVSGGTRHTCLLYTSCPGRRVISFARCSRVWLSGFRRLRSQPRGTGARPAHHAWTAEGRQLRSSGVTA